MDCNDCLHKPRWARAKSKALHIDTFNGRCRQPDNTDAVFEKDNLPADCELWETTEVAG